MVISTIQWLYSVLSGEPIDASAEDLSLNEVQQTATQAKQVRYCPAVPIETFDFIIDMIATGTDVKPLEVLLFMRDVRSRGYYEQMKGRGVRSLSHDGLRRVSNSADSAKTRFVLIDAVGVERSLKTDSLPLERKPDVPLKDLLQGVAIGHRDDEQLIDHINLEWIFRHNAQRTTAFTPEQTDWLRLMKEHIATGCTIGREDFDYAEFADKGGLQKVTSIQSGSHAPAWKQVPTLRRRALTRAAGAAGSLSHAGEIVKVFAPNPKTSQCRRLG